MANGTSFGEIFGGRLSEAGSQLLPLFQLIQNTQRQNEQDVFNRAVRVQQFESEAERLRQGRERIGQAGEQIDIARRGRELEEERIGVSERQADISQFRADIDFATAQKRILSTLFPDQEDIFEPKTAAAFVFGRAGRGIPSEQIAEEFGPLRDILGPVTGPTPPQQVARDIFGDVGTATQREATRQAQFRREGLEVPVLDPTTGQPLPLLGSQGQPQFEFNELGQQVPRLQMQPAPAPPPLFDTSSVIRSGLLGGVEGFDPNDPTQRQAALDALTQIDPRFGGFLEREGLGQPSPTLELGPGDLISSRGTPLGTSPADFLSAVEPGVSQPADNLVRAQSRILKAVGGQVTPEQPAAEPVGIQGRTLFDFTDQRDQEPDVFDTAQELFTAAEWQELSLRDQTDMAKAILQRENPNFDALPADLQQDSLNQKIADIESSLGII